MIAVPAEVQSEDSPVVDIEKVDLIPARDQGEADDASPASVTEQESPLTESADAATDGRDTVDSARSSQDAPRSTAVDPVDAQPNEAAESQHREESALEHAAVDSSTIDVAEPTSALPRTDQDSASPSEDVRAAADASSGGLLEVPGAEFAEVPINEVRENPRNPRQMFDEEALDELAFSLREVGVLQPVVVRPIPATDSGESFELVMGERRWRAAQRAGLATIPAIIRETSDDDLLRDALLENLHRTQLNPLEEAAAYQQMLDDFGCTQDELSDRIGRSRPQISNTLRLMKLPPLVQRRLASGALSAGHARALLTLDERSLMEELAGRIVAEGLSVREVERLVSRGAESTERSATPRRTTYNPRVVDISSKLSNRLEAPVRIDVGKRKGKITLEFTNLDDLERLVGRLGLEGSVHQDDEG